MIETLFDYHKQLVAKIEDLRFIAETIDLASSDAAENELGEAYMFIESELLPHARAEELVLYPAIGHILGSPKATETMARDHKEVARLAEELDGLRLQLPLLEKPTPAEETAVRRILYGLHAILHLHMAKEEELYFPLLIGHYNEEEQRDFIDAMERVGSKLKTAAAKRNY